MDFLFAQKSYQSKVYNCRTYVFNEITFESRCSVMKTNIKKTEDYNFETQYNPFLKHDD